MLGLFFCLKVPAVQVDGLRGPDLPQDFGTDKHGSDALELASPSFTSLPSSSGATGPPGVLASSSEGSSLTALSWAYDDLATMRESSISPESRLLGFALPDEPALDPETLAQLRAAIRLEAELRPDCAYLQRHQLASVSPALQLSSSMRRMGLGWLVEVSMDQGLTQETLALAAALLDRFMSRSRGVRTTQLQLLCCACLLVAAKHEEELHPAVSELTSLSAGSFAEEELRAAELAVLETLDFRINSPSSYTFLLLLARLLDLGPRVRALACYLTELAMLEYAALRYAPSQVAMAAVLLASLRLGEPLPRRALHACLAALPGASAERDEACAPLQPLVSALLALHQAAHAAPDGSEAAVVRDKFRAYEWQGAATVRPFARLPACAATVLDERGAGAGGPRVPGRA
ncbi:hypothetical protein QBZ16_000871 [Prototheca wickerhamii]|uniref:Cyclin N-terminal domain-containing protein n=1 Tax=Prototheca wickerhamii TaxID=3111 RepID=A0AAD9IF32_PROWI|nr:hypothetical protein QBZ16_000871 [Prototheca wickerhamii]